MNIADHLTKQHIARIVQESIASILTTIAPGEIRGDQSLADYGADSVDRVEIILSIMRRAGINEPMSSFSSIPNIGSLIDFVHAARRP